MSLEAIVTVACAIGSWVVAGWVTVNVVKAKMEDMARRIGTNEERLDTLYHDFYEFRIKIAEGKRVGND